MAKFSTKSRKVLERLGLKSKIDTLEKSQTLVTQLNNHTKQAKVDLNGGSGFTYETERKYGDINITPSNPMGQLDTLMHELGHANNLDLVKRVDWPPEGTSVDYPNATDLSLSDYLYHTTLNEGAAELNRNQILNELKEQGVLNEFPGLKVDSLYDPNKSRDEMIKELGESHVNNPDNIPAFERNLDPKYGSQLNYLETYAYVWLKNKGLLSDEQESRMTNQDIKDLMNKFKLFDNGSHTLDDIKDWLKKAQDWIGDKFGDWFEKINRSGLFHIYDPLVLDLDGDGVELVNADGWNGVQFDFNGNGIKTATQWVKSDDGLLVWDRNNNGAIDDGSELFGQDTPTKYGDPVTDGFSALKTVESVECVGYKNSIIGAANDTIFAFQAA